MTHDNFDNQNVVTSIEKDTSECMGALSGKNRSQARRRHHDEEKAKTDSQKTLDIVIAKSRKALPDANPDQHYRTVKKWKNASKKVHSKRTH